MTDVSEQFSTTHCDVVKVGNYSIAKVYKPPSEAWDVPNLLPPLPHPAIYVGDFNCHHPDWGYDSADAGGEQLIDWASCNDLALVHDPKQKGTFRSARWQREYSPDLRCRRSEAILFQPAVLSSMTFHAANTYHQSSTLVSLCRSYAVQQRNGGTFARQTGRSSLLLLRSPSR